MAVSRSSSCLPNLARPKPRFSLLNLSHIQIVLRKFLAIGFVGLYGVGVRQFSRLAIH